MSTDDNDAYGDLDKSNLKFIYGQFLKRKLLFCHESLWYGMQNGRCFYGDQREGVRSL